MFDLGRFGDIAETCERILNHNPDDLKARTTLAEFYRKKGDLDQAENLLKRIVSEDAGNQEALMELISLYVEGGDIKKIGRLLRDLETSRQNGRDSGGDSVVDTTLIGLR